MKDYPEVLSSLHNQGLFRELQTLTPSGALSVPEFGVNSVPATSIIKNNYLNFSSNDYLNLSHDPRLIEASKDAIMKWGCSAGASRLMTGNLEIHLELERALAGYLNQESALVFGSGFLTNLGVLTALAGRHDLIFSDRLNHASLIDGAQQSRAKVIRYAHNDLAELERLIKLEDSNSRKLIITESVFSMDGDLSSLEELCSLANTYSAILVVDEAHAIGVFESGILNRVKNKAKDIVIVGTLSKAFASYGGFVACSKSLRDLFINRARSFIYSTGLAPASCASALAAIKILKAEPELGAQVLNKAKHLHELLHGINAELLPFQSQIIPIVVNSNERALKISKQCKEKGILCNAIRPPTVPENTARLRLSVTAAHTENDLETLASVIKSLASL